MARGLGLLLLLSLPAEAAQCRLARDACTAVDQELALERQASAEADHRAQGLDPVVALPLLADLKVKRMTARVRVLPAPVAKEYLRIAACDLDAELARRGGTPSEGDCR